MINKDKGRKDLIEKARARIEEAIDQNGPYTHNIIGLCLAEVGEMIGNDMVNCLIDQFELDVYYGFVKS